MLALLTVLGLVVTAVGAGRRALRAVPFGSALEASLFGAALAFGALAYVTLALATIGVLHWTTLGSVVVAAAWWGRREALASGRAAWRAGRGWLRGRPDPIEWLGLALVLALLGAATIVVLAPPVGGDQTKYQLVYPRLYAEAHRLIETPWSFWGYLQYLMNMLFTAGFVLGDDVLARLLNSVYGVLATAAIFAAGCRLLSRRAGVWAALLFATMPMTATLMARAWVEFALALYVVLAVVAVAAWWQDERRSWLVLAGIMAGFAGGTKIMGLLLAALLGVGIFGRIVQRAGAQGVGRALGATVAFGALAGAVASPCYLRNLAATGNPVYPFGYGVFGGLHWSADAARGLDDYYAAYRTAQAAKRGGQDYGSWGERARFPWDMTMAPHSFEEVGRSSYDVGPFLLAFAPGVLLLRRQRSAWLLAALACAYGATIVLGMWPHPRYVYPAIPLLLLVAAAVAEHVATLVPGGRPLVAGLVLATLVGQSALAARVLAPTLPDGVRHAIGQLDDEAFLRRHERRYALWSLVNASVPPDGNVLVLGMIPHPYHLERPFTLASPLEQSAIDYRRIETVEELLAALEPFGVTHVVREVERPKPGANPIGVRVTRLWDALVARCDKIGEAPTGTLYRLRSALAAGAATGRV